MVFSFSIGFGCFALGVGLSVSLSWWFRLANVGSRLAWVFGPQCLVFDLVDLRLLLVDLVVIWAESAKIRAHAHRRYKPRKADGRRIEAVDANPHTSTPLSVAGFPQGGPPNLAGGPPYVLLGVKSRYWQLYSVKDAIF